jgi:protein-S-isoprenylcysteine O-methyltransferase Ste14
MIDHIRYCLGVFDFVLILPGLFFWFIIHPFARSWRRLGPALTYLIVVPMAIAIGVVVFHFRRQLLGTNFGTNWMLAAIALALYVVMLWVDLKYWRQLKISTLIGIPELSPVNQQKGKLLKEGIYSVIRHPRYLSAGLGVLSTVLFVNYAGLYIFILLVVPMGIVMLMLEERELVDRFGEAYRKYQREVPRFIPRRRKSRE